MDRKHNPQNTEYAKQLRNNMTPQERHLWYDFLSRHPARFTRQKVLGRYIADFYSAQAGIVIELDGSQHFEEQNEKYDSVRTDYLKQFGITVIRIPNIDLERNFNGVCKYIDFAIREHSQADSEKERT